MATRSEQFRADAQRTGKKKKRKNPEAKKPTRAKSHAAKKATYALEEAGGKRPSRKSSRKSANRAKPDSGLNIREEIQKGSPERAYEKAAAKR
jgi:hypothetical protein